MTTLTIDLMPELYERLRSIADARGTSVEDLAQEWLQQKSASDPAPETMCERARAALKVAGLLAEPTEEMRQLAADSTLTLEEARIEQLMALCDGLEARLREERAAANPDTVQGKLRVGQIDAQLQRERISEARYQRDRHKRVYHDSIDSLPDGAFIALGAEPTAYLVLGARLFPWNPVGYGPPIERPREMFVTVLTPASTVGVLAHGYQPALHPSVYEGAPRA